MENIIIIADDREKKVIPYAHSSDYDIRWMVKRLVHADYIIMFGGLIVALIERKRWNDLAQSIVDKRILNIENLKVLRKRIGCRIIVMVEGAKPSRKRAKRGVSYKAMRAKLDHLMIRDEVMLDYTASSADTAKRLEQLAYNITTLRELPVSQADQKGHDEVIGEILGGREQCEEVKTLRIRKEEILGWCAIPGVNTITMNLIRDAGYNLREILSGQLSMKKLSDMIYPESKIKIGYERAAKILKQLKKYDTHIAIIESVRGVSKGMAKCIFADYDDSIDDFLEDATVRNIGNIKYNRKKVGNAVAERIMNCINAKTTTDGGSDSDSDSDLDGNNVVK